jgi:phytoene desaturase
VSKPKVIVIGAGPGGLASAMLLASAGFDVAVIERDATVGGRTSSLKQDGFTFDRGPTFFLFPEVLESIFRMCGRRLRDEVELEPLDPYYRLVFEGAGKLDVNGDVDALKRQIDAIDPSDSAGLDAYLEDNRRKFQAFRPVLEMPFDSHMDLLKLPLLDLLPLMRPWASVDGDLKRFFRDPRVRLAFSFQSKYLGMSPFKCPSLFTILAFLEHEYGVHHPVGGCAAVTDAMARVARDMGVTIRLGEPVQQILLDGRRAVGVRTVTGEHRCDALVVNADFATAMRTLVPDRARQKWTDKHIAKQKMSCSTFMLYLGVEGRYDDLPHHTILLADGYEQHLEAIDEHFTLPTNPSIYVHNPSVVDGGLAPPGMSALYVLAPVPQMHPNVDWAAEKPVFRRVVFEQLAKLGLGGLERRVRTEVVYTPADWQSGMGLYKGATFSLAHSLGQMLSFRPHNRFEDIDGVYLVGGGTHPGSGLPVIFQSAKISTQLLAEDFGMADAWLGLQESRGTWPRIAEEAV